MDIVTKCSAKFVYTYCSDFEDKSMSLYLHAEMFKRDRDWGASSLSVEVVSKRWGWTVANISKWSKVILKSDLWVYSAVDEAKRLRKEVEQLTALKKESWLNIVQTFS
ncbi:hypothetical protein V6N13_074534 [Hibiscus sabdariffa]|uniref:Uncharacterized protein n=1 Tax=Hibiscus sabdariffa TaxID=183260 RepID=A0ABR2U8R6_9ROSI